MTAKKNRLQGKKGLRKCPRGYTLIMFLQSILELYCNIVVAVDELFPAASDSFAILVVFLLEAHQSVEIFCTTKDGCQGVC